MQSTTSPQTYVRAVKKGALWIMTFVPANSAGGATPGLTTYSLDEVISTLVRLGANNQQIEELKQNERLEDYIG